MSYMEQAMQTQMDGAIALQNQICDEACEIYKEIHLTPRQLLQQRVELLEALKRYVADSCEHDAGGGDVVVATCESREIAISVIEKMESA